nr:MAG TPA_asm: Glycyl-tRNA synthetase beta subunit [Caudoviricetes sp.]
MPLSSAACTARPKSKKHRLKRWPESAPFSIRPVRWVLARLKH